MPATELQIRQLQASIGYEFTDAALILRALSHRSVGADNNERLEFLGDSVLNFVISQRIFASHPEATEGDLSRLRALLVKGVTLAEISRGLGMGDLLTLGAGELKSGGHNRSSILADAVEAVLGAILIDGGFEAASATVDRLFSDRLNDLPPLDELKDPKTRLQEFLQKHQHSLPGYELVETTGQAHAATFVVGCRVKGQQKETLGRGSSRRKAEQAAAEKMLRLVTGEKA
jgi:ribonuclease-3